ncbi:MAG: hypothetical protein ABII09_02380 [Planctomycetota bacterium]
MEPNTPNQRPSESVIRFNCTFCRQQIRVPSIHAGKKVKCPKCKNVVIIPQTSPTSHPSQENEPIRLKRDGEPSPGPVQPIHTPPQQWHRIGPEPSANIAEDVDTFKQSPEQEPATILNVFTFPFSLAGVLHFILFWFGPFLLGLAGRILAGACCYGQVLVIGLYFALLGYFFYYLSSCIVAAAKDERFAPDVSFENTPGFFDLLGRALLVFGCTLACFGPMILYVFFAYIWPAIRNRSRDELFALRTDPWYWILYGLGVFFLPMFLLAAALFDSIAALNPLLIIASVAGTFLSYCGLALLFCVIGLLMNFVGQLQPGGLSLLAWGFDVYLMFIAAYILGRFFRRYENNLKWEVKL